MKSKKATPEGLAAELASELKYLRGMIRDVGEGFILRKEGEIETLLSYLATITPQESKVFAAKWLREMRTLKVKPAKGRLKDLKNLDGLLEDFLNSIIDLQHESNVPPSGKARPKRAKQVADDKPESATVVAS
jgi:hypothetical protein